MIRPAANFSIAVIVAVVLFSSTASARELHQGAFAISGDKDAPGNDYKELDGVSLQKCQRTCSAEAQCKLFTYVVPKGICFLKNGADAQITDVKGAITGRKQVCALVGSSYTLVDNTDIRLVFLRNEKAEFHIGFALYDRDEKLESGELQETNGYLHQMLVIDQKGPDEGADKSSVTIDYLDGKLDINTGEVDEHQEASDYIVIQELGATLYYAHGGASGGGEVLFKAQEFRGDHVETDAVRRKLGLGRFFGRSDVVSSSIKFPPKKISFDNVTIGRDPWWFFTLWKN